MKSSNKLTYLNLASNQVEDISALKNKQHLNHLYLSNNPVASIAVLGLLKALQTLSIVNANLQVNPNFQFQSQLLFVNLSKNKLKSVSFLKNQQKLLRLKLNDNQISNIDDLKGLHNLKIFPL